MAIIPSDGVLFADSKGLTEAVTLSCRTSVRRSPPLTEENSTTGAGLLQRSFQLGISVGIGISRSKVIWTARLTPDFLDGDEPLIQDPLIRPLAQPLI